jgi:hypothetical protein
VKKSIYSNFVAASLALCCFAGIAAAQPGIEGDTAISYDDETGMVTVYGETINGLDTDYASQMSVVVKDQNGTTVASGNDYQLWDNAAVALEFQGNPGSVYTATSNHCVRMQSWSYDNEFPYHQFYYDYWYMSSFLGQNILSPWYYWFASPGWQEVHRTTNVICTGKTYASVAVVSVQKIQYKTPGTSTYVDITGTQYVLKGTTVEFKAIPDPATATFPSGQPVWSGTSGATGTGVTKSVPFNTASSSSTDYKTVIATAAGPPKTVNVIVYDLDKAFAPVDTWAGRAETTFGLKELVNLSITITPSGVTSTQAGGLEWSIVSGTGTLESHADNNGTGSFTAPASPGNTTLKLNVLSGPSKDKNITQDVTTIKPSGTRLVKADGRRHVHNIVDAGFTAIVYLDPTNVSFKNITISEDTCPAVTAGYFSGVVSPHPASTQPNLVLACNATTGCRGFFLDKIYMGYPGNPPSPTPVTVGTWTWTIPWYYDNPGGDPVPWFTVDQVLTSDTSGNGTTSKGGASQTYNMTDSSVKDNWPD